MLSRYAKAFTAFVSAFAVPFAGALTESSDQGNVATQGEWVTAIVAGLLAAFAVAAVPNRPPKGEVSDPGVSEQDPQRQAGYSVVELLVGLVVLIIVVLLLLELVDRL